MTLEEYITAHIEPEGEVLSKINRDTHIRTYNPRMLSGHLQGRLLSMLSKMIQPQRILELGTFTGYSALCLAEGLRENGELHTVESNDEMEEFIRHNLSLSPLGKKITLYIQDALQFIDNTTEMYDMIFIDADKRQYKTYYEKLIERLNPNGYIIADNTLWDGKVLTQPQANDYQTIGIKEFNDYIAQDDRIEKIILPLRDGMTIIRKKS